MVSLLWFVWPSCPIGHPIPISLFSGDKVSVVCKPWLTLRSPLRPFVNFKLLLQSTSTHPTRGQLATQSCFKERNIRPNIYIYFLYVTCCTFTWDGRFQMTGLAKVIMDTFTRLASRWPEISSQFVAFADRTYIELSNSQIRTALVHIFRPLTHHIAHTYTQRFFFLYPNCSFFGYALRASKIYRAPEIHIDEKAHGKDLKRWVFHFTFASMGDGWLWLTAGIITYGTIYTTVNWGNCVKCVCVATAMGGEGVVE